MRAHVLTFSANSGNLALERITYLIKLTERFMRAGLHYKGQYGGFYYDRHVGQWRDPEGEICHTCTPENGFPARGG